MTDCRFFVALVVAPELAIQLKEHDVLATGFRRLSAAFPSRPIALRIRIHPEVASLTAAFSTVHTRSRFFQRGSELVAFYDRASGALHISIDASEWTQTFKDFADRLRKGGHAYDDIGMEVSRRLSGQLREPIAHELWHFVSHHSPVFRGLPVALEEGFACLAQFKTDRLQEGWLANKDALKQMDTPARDPKIEKLALASMPRLCQDERDYRKRILDAHGNQDLPRLDSVLSYGPVAFHKLARDPQLLYAIGWALAHRILEAPALFDSVRAHTVDFAVPPSGRSGITNEFWRRLTKECVHTARQLPRQRR